MAFVKSNALGETMQKPQYTWFKVEEMPQNHQDTLRGRLKPLKSNHMEKRPSFQNTGKILCA